MATSQEVIKLLRDSGKPEGYIKQQVEALGGSYTPPAVSPMISGASIGVSGPQDLLQKSNLPKPGFLESVGNFFAPTTTANIKDVISGVKAGGTWYNRGGAITQQEEQTKKIIALTEQAKQARLRGDLATAKKLNAQAKAIGETEIEMPEFSQYTQKQAEAGLTGNVGDYLGRGLKSGVEIGSYLLPSAKALGVTSVMGKAGLGALGGGMRGYGSSGYGEALGGTLGGAAVGGGLSLIGSGLKGLAKQADKAGENVITKVFKKNQTYNFKDKTGEEMGEFINRHKKDLKGDYFASSVELSKKLQSDFDELARNSGVKIKDSQLKKIFQKEIDRLRSTGLTKNVNTAKKLEKELQGILGNLGKQFDISDLTQARVDADDLTTFGNTKGTRGFYGIVRELEQKTVQNAVKGRTVNGRNLEQIGKELNKIYTFKDMARNIKSSNVGGKALSLTNLLSAGVGGISGGVPGAIGGLAVNQALSSPTGTRAVSNVLQNVVSPGLNVLGNVAGSKLASQALIGGMSVPQQETTDMGVEPQITPVSAPQTNEGLDTGNLPKPILSPKGQWRWDETQNDWVPNKQEQTGQLEQQAQTSLTGYTPEELYGAAIKAYQAGDKSSYSQLMNMYDEETKYQDRIVKNKEKLEKSKKGNVGTSIDMMEKLYSPGTPSSLSMGTKTVGLSALTGRAGVAKKKVTNQDYVDRLNKYKTQMALVAGAINQAAGAGVLNGGEYARLAMESFPNEYTSEAVARAWFDNAREVLNSLPEDRATELADYLNQ
jgi:hypothetical protein